MKNLRNRSFLTLLDFSRQEVEFLLTLSEDLKRAKYIGTEKPMLKNKNIALLFEKDSTRTRCAFEVAAHDQGANVTYLGPTGSQMGKKETTKDTARVLGGMYDGIEYRGFSQRTVETLAEYSGVPVWIHRNLVTTVFIGFGVPNGSLNYILSKILVVFLSSSLNFSSNK